MTEDSIEAHVTRTVTFRTSIGIPTTASSTSTGAMPTTPTTTTGLVQKVRIKETRVSLFYFAYFSHPKDILEIS